MHEPVRFLIEHEELTRRYFVKLGVGGMVAGQLLVRTARGEETSPELAEAIAKLEPYFTLPDDFNDVSRGKPVPHSLPEDKQREVGLTRETWKLEVIADPDYPVKLRKTLSKADNSALDFAGLLQLAEKHAVRFPKVMTCLNIGCPLGMGIWEGVPLREVVWMTTPREDLRRVFYYGYHNDDPKQMFKSSLPIGRVLEDPFDLPPVILCTKLNGQWLTPERGGPVRVLVPEGYGFKSIKWLTHVVLTSLPHANDTYGEQGNDIDSPLKSFAATLSASKQPAAGRPIPLTGYAQVGIGGLSKVQVWIQRDDEPLPAGDPYFTTAPWRDMEILPPPEHWGGNLPDDTIPPATLGFDPDTKRPRSWPMRLCKIHWAGVHPGLSPGKYTLRSRAVDSQGHGQPMPRPFRKSGHAAIEEVRLTVA
ncbi:MAG: molybdopterin-dependent oxidoreductase [Pirellulales bacterium]